jgi:hypothetical protein
LIIIIKRRNKLIFIGIGSSGLNVTNEWIKEKGEGFCLMQNIDKNSEIVQFDNLDDITKQIDPNRKYVVVTGLGGKSANEFIEPLFYRLSGVLKTELKILSYLPFEFEGSIRNKQAIEIHNRLKNYENYNFIDLKENFSENKNNELNKTFKKMDKKGIKLIKNNKTNRLKTILLTTLVITIIGLLISVNMYFKNEIDYNSQQKTIQRDRPSRIREMPSRSRSRTREMPSRSRSRTREMPSRNRSRQ